MDFSQKASTKRRPGGGRQEAGCPRLRPFSSIAAVVLSGLLRFRALVIELTRHEGQRAFGPEERAPSRPARQVAPLLARTCGRNNSFVPKRPLLAWVGLCSQSGRSTRSATGGAMAPAQVAASRPRLKVRVGSGLWPSRTRAACGFASRCRSKNKDARAFVRGSALCKMPEIATDGVQGCK